jgi:hypothetical protein
MNAATADPQKTPTDRQQHGKHVSAVTNNHATRKKLLEVVFSMWSVQRLHNENQQSF